MLRPWMRAMVLTSVLGSPTAGRGEGLFEDPAKDFGSVPRGTLLTHAFPLTNTTRSSLRITGLRTSCSCVTAAAERSFLDPGEATVIAVTVDTRKYAGPRAFTVYVQFDPPSIGEVRLVVQATSREDVTVNPGQLSMGRVKKGSAPVATVTIEYHGTRAWQITGIENENGYLQPEVKELSRGPGHAVYQLKVQLREDTPVGAWYADVWLSTNDPATPRFRVPLVVEVEGPLTATPRDVVIGRVKPGSRTERKVVIRGSQAFRIASVDGGDDSVQIQAGSDEKRTVHVLTVAFQAGPQAGDITRRLRVVTDLPDEQAVEFSVQAQVVP
jgi:Protein of unknown function (DUF1573)